MWEQLLENSSPQDLVSAITILLAILGTYIAIQAVKQGIRTRQAEAMLQVLKFASPELLHQIMPRLYNRYANGELTTETVRSEMNEYSNLLWRLDRIGVLLYHNYVPRMVLIDMFPHWPIRMWIIFEEYIRGVRTTRPRFFQFFEYLAYVCLITHMKKRPYETLLIGEPAHDTEIQKSFTETHLMRLLQKMKKDLIKLGLYNKMLDK